MAAGQTIETPAPRERTPTCTSGGETAGRRRVRTPMNWKWNFVINVLGKGGAVLVAFLFTPVFVRMMGLEAYSLVAVFIAFLSLTFVLDFAFGATMTRELARYSVEPGKDDAARDLARSLEYLYLAAGIAVAVAGCLAAPAITRNWLNLQDLSYDSVRNSIALMALAVGLQFPLGMYVGGMYGLDRQPTLNLAQFLLSLLRYGGAVIAMWRFGSTAEVFFAWQLAFSLLQTLTMRTLLWRFLPRGSRRARFNGTVLRGTLHFTSRVAGTAVASFVLNQLDKIVLSRLVPLSVLGSYQIGTQLGNATRLLSTLVETVVMPRMVVHTTRGDELALRALYHESCQFVALMTLPFSAAVVFFAEPLITLWIGDAGIAAAAALPAMLLTLGSAINALVRVPAGVTLARGWASFGMWESLISGAVFVPTLIVMVRLYGAVGAAGAWLMLNAGSILICAPIIHARVMANEFRTWLIWSAAVPAAVTFGTSALARMLLPPSAPPVAAGFAALTWAVASLACVFAMPHTRSFALTVLRRLLAR
jgi:O-antigen/teichoic acid export membrane protein